MKVKIKEWHYDKPEQNINKWVLFLMDADGEIKPSTTTGIKNLYNYGVKIYQWSEIEIEDLSDEQTN